MSCPFRMAERSEIQEISGLWGRRLTQKVDAGRWGLLKPRPSAYHPSLLPQKVRQGRGHQAKPLQHRRGRILVLG